MIIDILDKKCCLINMKAKKKEEALKILAKQASKSEKTGDLTSDKLFELLNIREKQGSTGFGNGIAIPHARIKGMKEFFLFIAISPKGIEFDAMDKKKVHIFFVILGPADQVNEHLKILAGISQIVSDANVRTELIRAATVTSLYESFIRHTSVSTQPKGKKKKMKLVYIILYLEEFMYHILEMFIQEGIEGANILESSGMGEYISNVPLFADFIGFMQTNKNKSKTIMALVPEDDVEALIEGVEKITGDLDKKQGATIIVSDVTLYRGSMKMM